MFFLRVCTVICGVICNSNDSALYHTPDSDSAVSLTTKSQQIQNSNPLHINYLDNESRVKLSFNDNKNSVEDFVKLPF